jgi:hypothetical protein
MGKTDTSSTVKLSGEFSQSKGLTIYHEGGDPVELRYAIFRIRPGDSGNGFESLVYEVNKSVIGNMEGTCSWYSWTCMYSYFKPGDIAHVTYENRYELEMRPDRISDYNASTGLGNSVNLGSYFTVELVDSRGKIIGQTKVLIQP